MSEKRRQLTAAEREADGGVQIRSFAAGYSGGYTIQEHSHDWHQLIYAVEGVMSVFTSSGCWVVPRQRAVWVPAGVCHKIETSGSVSMRTLYLARGLSETLPNNCCVVNISPLLRELILHAISLGALDSSIPSHSRLIGVILDQMDALPTVPLQLPSPADSRARKAAEILRGSPGEPCSLEQISKAVGASKRTLERLFCRETGMTFGKWRQQMRLLHALRLLATGERVTTVALEAGYESTSAFIAVFKEVLGTTPGRYYNSSSAIAFP